MDNLLFDKLLYFLFGFMCIFKNVYDNLFFLPQGIIYASVSFHNYAQIWFQKQFQSYQTISCYDFKPVFILKIKRVAKVWFIGGCASNKVIEMVTLLVTF